jgi:phosphodiesterase/alkaline phosphatase D-like protein
MKIAVASCAKVQSLPIQPAWKDIQAAQPDVLLLLGDNIYLEHNSHNDPGQLSSELRSLYERQCNQPDFAALLADLARRNAPVVATYDDHDFLGNNRYGGDHAPSLRGVARSELIRAFKPQQTGNDVYSVYKFGLVDLAILDVRFYRRASRDSAQDGDAILGTEQWKWLERTVADSTAPYLLVASSTTVHRFADESWAQYPAAFQRLLRLLSDRNGAFVVSGDIHENEVCDETGLIELVTSAVARLSILSRKEQRNWALLSFDSTALHVDMRSLKVNGRRLFSVPLNNWVLP